MMIRNKHQILAMAAACALAACDSKSSKSEVKNSRAVVEDVTSANGDTSPTRGVSLVVKGLKDSDITPFRSHSLKTLALTPGIPIDVSSIGVHLTIKAPDGSVTFDETRFGRELDWAIELAKMEGFYTIDVTIVGDALPAEFPTATWHAVVDLDLTPPALALTSQMKTSPKSGLRDLAATLIVKAERSVSCREATIKSADPTQLFTVTFEKETTAATIGVNSQKIDHKFALNGAIVPSNLVAPFTLTMICVDGAGNANELTHVVGIEAMKYSLNTYLRADAGVPFEGGSRAGFIKSRVLSLDFKLLDNATGSEIAGAAVALEKPFIRIVVVDELPTSIEQLAGKTPLWSGTFDAEAKVMLPDSYKGRKLIYSVLLRKDANSGKEAIVSSSPVAFYIDEVGPDLVWQPALLNPPTKDSSISVKLTARIEGAPMRGDLVLEVTEDDKEFKAIKTVSSITEVRADAAVYTIAVSYPFDGEKPFRLRARGTDLAGNTVVSPTSPMLVARALLPLTVPATERAACVRGTASGPASKLAVHHASAFLCKKKDKDGKLLDALNVALVLQNRGSQAISLINLLNQPAGMGFKVLVDGILAGQGRYEPGLSFILATTEMRLFNLELNATWLEKQKIELLFNSEPTGGNSIENFCNQPDVLPTVVVMDKAAQLELGKSPFPCDAQDLVSAPAL